MTLSTSTAATAATQSPVVQEGYVPVIDVSGAFSPSATERLAVGRAIDEACRESGFFVIVGHGVDPELVREINDVTLGFFHESATWKRQWACGEADPTIRGHFARKSSVSAGEQVQTAPDLCELFTINQLGEPGIARKAGLGEHEEVWSRPNVWPDRPVGFRKTWTDYYDVMSDLTLHLMRMCALGLDLPEEFFTPLVDAHISNLTANWYPPIEDEPLPEQYRKGPHSDWGTLTVLYQDGVGGLQVRTKAGAWMDVPKMKDSFVVNIGDLMAVWTNDAWVSTKHRVLAPQGDARSVQRVSIPFFHQPNWSARVECLPSCSSADNPAKYPPVQSGEYLLGKIQASFNSPG